MGQVIDAHGTSWDFNGVEVKPTSFTIPGWSKEEINVTDHGNSDVTTKALSALKDWGQLVVTCPYDPSEHNVLYEQGAITEGTTKVTITGADDSTLEMWVDVQQVGDIELPANNSDMPTYDLTMTLTNRTDASPPVEEQPKYTAAP